MQIVVKAVGDVVTKKSKTGKDYQVFEIMYKNDGKAGSRQIMSFSKVYTALKEASPGEIFDIGMVKNGEYWEWTTAVPAGMETTPVAVAEEATGATVKRAATPTRSTYETPEERAAKQVFIVRQSSISAAIAMGNSTVHDVIEVAKQFEAYVFGTEVKVPEGIDTSVD